MKLKIRAKTNETSNNKVIEKINETEAYSLKRLIKLKYLKQD